MARRGTGHSCRSQPAPIHIPLVFPVNRGVRRRGVMRHASCVCRVMTPAALLGTASIATVTCLVLGGVLAACGGHTSLATDASGDGGGGGGGDSGSTKRAPPAEHRAIAPVCAPSPVGAEPTIPDAGADASTFACARNEDCTARAGGRCVYSSGACGEPCQVTPPGSGCLYDECTTDKNCPTASICQCGQGGPSPNGCSLVGNCRVDADCASGYCSPSADGCGTFNGYFCHSAGDTCSDDADCRDNGGGLLQKCVVDSATQAWSCKNVGCAQAGSSGGG